ncbi:uncharacterized protein C5orf34 homolog isoform X2 [Clinocottus analis]|uniref:uncharacterized protein C5orf34 homolog isoform X2 n=1 Tax=Clinocottus analis TaxID=304258 RepID=UPI0035C113D1
MVDKSNPGNKFPFPVQTMETRTSVSLMIMYEDESVDVRYGNGAQLQLSPCGCEFMLVKPSDPSSHPLQSSERTRQRTRFTISTYKELMVAALAFRNKYASRPYLPEELIPVDHKKPFFSIDTDVLWPELSSCDGEEFSIKFTCSLSQDQRHIMQGFSKDFDSSSGIQQQQESNLICHTTNGENQEVHQGSGRNESIRSRSCSPRMSSTAQPKPEKMYQSTTVVQHHSCCAVAPIWRYPLSLARHLWTAYLSTPKEVGEEGTSDIRKADGIIQMFDISIEDRKSHLPQALPLTCPSPHWHRWKFKEPLAKNEHSDQDLPTELVKVMWCQGVTYRIQSGAVSVIEVSPGDGSVIRSNGVLDTYFTHYKPELLSRRVKQITYHLNNLQPDVPGQLYSVSSIVRRASRILTSYNEAKHSLKLSATPCCLQEGRHISEPDRMEENQFNLGVVEQHANDTQMVESRSDLVAAELEKIKRFNFLLENNHLLRSEKSCAQQDNSAKEVTHEPMNEKCINEALQKTSKAIQDIDALISAATLT